MAFKSVDELNAELADWFLDHHAGEGILVMESGSGNSFNSAPARVRELLDSFGVRGDDAVRVEDAPFLVVDHLVASFGSMLGERVSALSYLHELSHKDGTPARFRELFEDPSAHSLGSGSGECDRCLVDVFPCLHVYALEQEADRLWQDRVAQTLVECYGLACGGDSRDEVCAVFCGPEFAEQLDLSSDALTPVSGQYGDARHVCNVPSENLRGFIYHRPRLSVEEKCSRLVGYVLAWPYEGGSYECFVSERPYESRPERAIVLDDSAWDLLADSYGDLIGEQPHGFLCLQFVFHGPDNDFRFDASDGFLHRRLVDGGGGAVV